MGLISRDSRVRVAIGSLLLLALCQSPVHAQCPPGSIACADGKLDTEAVKILDLNSNGVPDVLETRFGAAAFQLDNRLDGGQSVGPDGFRDSTLAPNIIPGCASCVDTSGRARSPINTGTLSVIYFPDSDAHVDVGIPASDDSLLYVGFDICNGDRRRVGDPGGIPNVDYHDIDRQIELTTLCNAGFQDQDLNGFLSYFMVPFDTDGDGDPAVISRDFSAAQNGTCPILLEGNRDRQEESYRVQVRTCAGSAKDTVLLIARLSMDTEGVGDQVTLTVVAPGGNPNLAEISAFPIPGTTNDQIKTRGLQAFGGVPAAVGTLDVEFVIKKIDSVLQARHPTFPYTINRFRMFSGRIVSQSTSTGDLSEEDEIEYTFNMQLPELEIAKQVRCLGREDNAWADSIEASPGSIVEFKVDVQSSGNVDVNVFLEDVLESLTPGVTATVDPSFLQAQLFRPSLPGGVVMITPANAAGLGLNPAFFTPLPCGFLAGVAAGDVRYLGVLQGAEICNGFTPGDHVELIFRATVDAVSQNCGLPNEMDVRNTITGTADVDPPISIPGPGCQLFMPAAENGNEVSVAVAVEADVLCRNITFTKSVGFAGAPPNNFVTGVTPLNIPTIAPGNSAIFDFRYTVTNVGESSDTVTVSDPELCADMAGVIATYGAVVSFENCAICTIGPQEVTLGPDGAANDTATLTCRLRFAFQDALEAFMMTDEGGATCNESDPGDPGPKCYRNCAEVSAGELEVTCDGGQPPPLKAFATVCRLQEPPGGCCLPDGTCAVMDQEVCELQGGAPYPPGSVCSGPQACCTVNGDCINMSPECCLEYGGFPNGPGSHCFGDGNDNGRDDACEAIPTVSEWGLIVLALGLLIAARRWFYSPRAARRPS